jgi:SAM-dependent methyltransferase
MCVLEVGPGDGYLTLAASERISPGGSLVCLDVQLAMLGKLRRALGSHAPPLVCASGSQLPFRSQAFDLVFLAHVLGEIPDRAGALAEYARVLRPGGTLAVTEGLPDPDFIRCGHLVRMARRAGFVPAERLGRALHYTQRFRIGEDAALQGITGRPRPRRRRGPWTGGTMIHASGSHSCTAVAVLPESSMLDGEEGA